MSTTAMKIILDTNVFISCIGKASPYRWIFDGILEGRFILCISNDILLEYHEVLARKTTPEIADNLTNFLTVFPNVQQTDIFYNWQLIREDPDDNKFVDCAVSANAVCIVSNDKHFRVLQKAEFPAITVMGTEEFEEVYRGTG